jgi:hypothetical protein
VAIRGEWKPRAIAVAILVPALVAQLSMFGVSLLLCGRGLAQE